MLPSVSEQNFTQQILESPLPVVLNFWTPWCGLCLAINPLLLEFKSQWQGNINIFSINPDENLKIASTYRLASLPTLLFFNQGQVVERIEGFQGREELNRLLKKSALLLSKNAKKSSILRINSGKFSSEESPHLLNKAEGYGELRGKKLES